MINQQRLYMHSNVHVTLHPPFLYPTNPIQRLELVSCNFGRHQTQLTINHSFKENISPDNRLQSHKSLDNRGFPHATNVMFTERGDISRNALATKNKIDLTAYKKKFAGNDREGLQREAKDLKGAISRIQKDHQIQVECLEAQIKSNEEEIERLRQSQLKSQTKKNQEMSSLMSETIDTLEGKLKIETERFNMQKRECNSLKRQLFQLQAEHTESQHEVQQLRRMIQTERNVYNHSISSLSGEVNTLKSDLRPHHLNCISICEMYTQAVNIIDKIRPSQLPHQLVQVKEELDSNREVVTEVLQTLQSLLGEYKGKGRKEKAKARSVRMKGYEKSVNESERFLRTCDDQDYASGGDSSLYQMLLAQAELIDKAM